MRRRSLHSPPLVVASYNVHRCIGRDRRHDPERVATVIRQLEADVVALQEVDAHYHIEHGVDQLAFLAAATGYVAVPGPVLRNHRGHYGNGLLIRHELVAVRHHDLSVRGRERRAALDVDLSVGGVRLRIVAAHLGLGPRERQAQMRRLLALLRHAAGGPTVLLGDFNEWLDGAPLLRRVHARFGRTPGLRTFPSRFPVFALDRIWVEPRRALLELAVHRSVEARRASDHLPIRAVINGSLR